MYFHALQNQSLIVQQIAIVWCLHQTNYQLKYLRKKKLLFCFGSHCSPSTGWSVNLYSGGACLKNGCHHSANWYQPSILMMDTYI